MLPDPRVGPWLRALAIAAYFACVAFNCSRTSDAAHTGRIVSVGGAVTETVFALGQGARVVAVDTSSVFPAPVTKLPQVGYQRMLSSEGILAQNPELVIASADAGPPAVLDQLRAAGVRVEIIPNAQTPEAAAKRIETIGAVLHTDAAALAAQVRTETAAARSQLGAGSPRALVIYARGAGTLLVAGADTTAAAMLELAGATNAAGSFAGYKPLSAEALVAAAPDVIVIPSRGLETIGGEAGLLALPGVAATPAGRAKKFVAMDDLELLGFGPRLGASIAELARRLRP